MTDKTNASRQKRWRDKRRAGWWRLLYLFIALGPVIPYLRDEVSGLRKDHPLKRDVDRLTRQYRKSRDLFKLHGVDLEQDR